MNKRIGIREIIILIVVFVVLFFLWFGFRHIHRETGNRVLITVAGESLGEYDLLVDREIPIEIDGDVTNILQITDGEADMTWADCPDQTCVNTAPISASTETIVCLPHQVVVEVISSDEKIQFDVIAQ